MENCLIKIEDLQIGDEVIVRGLDLNYLKILRLPKQKTRTYTNHLTGITTNYNYMSTCKCERMNYEKLENKYQDDKIIYFNFSYKAIWLVKRKNNV